MCDALMFTRSEFIPFRLLPQDLQHFNPIFSWHGVLDYLWLEIFTTAYTLTAGSSYRAVDVWDLLHVLIRHAFNTSMVSNAKLSYDRSVSAIRHFHAQHVHGWPAGCRERWYEWQSCTWAKIKRSMKLISSTDTRETNTLEVAMKQHATVRIVMEAVH